MQGAGLHDISFLAHHRCVKIDASTASEGSSTASSNPKRKRTSDGF